MNHALHPVNREIAVKFESVFFSYGDVSVLENTSFHIHQGEFVALTGPNGSGKTTVLKLILGLERPRAGRIELFGASREKADAWRDRLGYVPQQAPSDQSFPIGVRDVVRMGLLRPFRRYAADAGRAVNEALEQAGIADLAARSYRALSGGQRRRVLVARALASRPDILILDEPTANMDSQSETRLFETLGRLKGSTTILIVTHDADFVSALTGRVLCLGDNGFSRRGVVQHRIEAAPEGASRGVRVIHSENIPADNCYDQEEVRDEGSGVRG